MSQKLICLDPANTSSPKNSIQQLVIGLTKGNQEEDRICQELSSISKFLSDNTVVENILKEVNQTQNQLTYVDCLVRVLEYLDPKKPQTVQSHATIAVSLYIKAMGDVGSDAVSEFLLKKIQKETYEDSIVAFSIATFLFPVIPDLISSLFLKEGFVSSLGIMIRGTWKSNEMDLVVLKLLNAACISTPCREAMRATCIRWLEEIIFNTPKSHMDSFLLGRTQPVENNMSQKDLHFQLTLNLASVILSKLQVVTSKAIDASGNQSSPTYISSNELHERLKRMLFSSFSQEYSIEGLAYSSIQPHIKEDLASDKVFLETLIKVLGNAPAKSPETYGALTILMNLTLYMPALSEEQKRISQLKAYANATKESNTDKLNNNENVQKRCRAIFEAGVIPVLVTHSQHGSLPSLTLVTSIIFSLSKLPNIRGIMAQQGAVKLLLNAFSTFPPDYESARRTTAHALACILISTNPLHVFGGASPLSIVSAIRPLVLILSEDPASQTCDLLPVFESLLALTNLASTDDIARDPIIRLACSQIDELLLSNNTMITRAAAELVCNLVQSPEGVHRFGHGEQQAGNRLHILIALTDVEDIATRRAAGGALASLTAWDTVVPAILGRETGVKRLLALCNEDQEELRHRGIASVLNLLSAPGESGIRARIKIEEEAGINVLKECLKKSRSQEVLDITVEALKKLLPNS
ncbi:BgTH12-05121 [Blumeria graminis f. sp. triticale]|uniref:Bgt-2897 n=3 Tax=Blumeria graminis TaxID=34373 RepID=A0A061HJL5_BLUGR|nr:hypothetical protein BGT96224_2897 [Blumeria graminis f. sp. tritici 96224]CAD6502530.1 BgTH12-05121 [Blumeria graminis f. sp. triticale]VDB87908.1 Bgt-2897 [Blumeria graminis f. sp. tritici]